MLRVSFSGSLRCRSFLYQKSNLRVLSTQQSKYSATIKLPQTSFSQRANSQEREPELQKWWVDNRIYEKLTKGSTGKVPFVLHDGPPYANGDLHIGHALNKILKDIINKYQMLKGKQVHYVPGWDCHGLPIEMKVLQSMSTVEKQNASPLDIRKRAAGFARETMDMQRNSFKRYGVWGDWDNSYNTMQPSYEASQIRVFGEMLQKGYIYRGRKPVHWSPSSHTALAEAELEYNDNHISQSAYVGFPVDRSSSSLKNIINTLPMPNVEENRNLLLCIWTTTPWTIPANVAVAVHKDIDYAVIGMRSDDNYYIVAEELVDVFAAKFEPNTEDSSEPIVYGTLKGIDLVGTTYSHPLFCDLKTIEANTSVGTNNNEKPAHNLYEKLHSVIIGGDYITTSSGTGLVHTAPGHGKEDYDVGLQNSLPVVAPVNDRGKFTAEISPFPEICERLCGLSVLKEGNEEVLMLLLEKKLLLFGASEPYTHKYPYDWRTKKPIIMRATEQWFASVASFRQDVLNAIKNVQWVPEAGEKRITSMTNSRGDWCISRQRAWGVPIPVFYHKETNVPLINAETIEYVAKLFETDNAGANKWFESDIKDLLPDAYKHLSDDYYVGYDTMDVWFDSGTSWAGVLRDSGDGRQDVLDQLQKPFADLYLEGSDQHRGWFQSSLLTSVAVEGTAPYKSVVTHGFVLDAKGQKMSKSIGNVVDPDTVINGTGGKTSAKGKGGKSGKGKGSGATPAYGADTLRLWVSSVDYQGDVCIGNDIMKTLSESYRKIRNTMRFLLGSLDDYECSFTSGTTEMEFDELPSFDQYILLKLHRLSTDIDKCYSEYDFAGIYSQLNSFLANDLSSFYLDICKDRLYISHADEYRRRSCQYVLKEMLEQITVMVAPIVPHLSEDIWQHRPYASKSVESVFEKGWIHSSDKVVERSNNLQNSYYMWESVRNVRSEVNRCIELMRRDKIIGSSSECQVVLHVDSNVEAPSDGDTLVEYLSQLLSKGAIDSGNTGGEGKMYLHSNSQLDQALASNAPFSNPPAASPHYGTDDLRFVLKVSQVKLLVNTKDRNTVDNTILLKEMCPDYHTTIPIQVIGIGATRASGQATVSIGVTKASGKLCERCWLYCDSVGDVGAVDDVCHRCNSCL